MATQVSGANADASGWLTLNGQPVLFQDDTENLDAGATEYQKNYFLATAQTPHRLKIYIDEQFLDTKMAGYWEWKPRSYAGLYELRVEAPGYPDVVTKVRVVPRYFTQALYRKMQDELSSIAVDLLFSLVSSISERVENVRRLQESSPLQEYRRVRAIIERLGSILSAIRRDPYAVLSRSIVQRDWQEVWQFDGDSQAISGDVVRIPERVSGQPGGLIVPATWRVPQPVLSYDVYENRLLKQFVQQQLIVKLNAIQERAEAEIRQRRETLAYMQKHKFRDVPDEQREIAALEKAIEQCKAMKRRCLRWSSEAFLHTVRGEVSGSKATQVLLKHPDYSRFYKLYLQFQQQLQISLNSQTFITEISQRKMSDLYEMWSVFTATRMIIDELRRHGYEHVSQQLFYEIEKQSFHFTVRKNVASIVLARDDTRVKIIYEPRYPNASVTQEERLVTTHGRNLPQTPDMAVEIEKRNKPYAVCIFDAKYRSEKDSSNGYFYPLDEDIDKMLNYATHIQYQRYDRASRRFRPAPIVTSAYVLYPGNLVYEDVDGKIGGIPLRTGMSSVLTQKVEQKLRELLQKTGVL